MPHTFDWDSRVVFAPDRGYWWWNAWDPEREIELSGYAASRAQAETAMSTAMTATVPVAGPTSGPTAGARPSGCADRAPGARS